MAQQVQLEQLALPEQQVRKVRQEQTAQRVLKEGLA